VEDINKLVDDIILKETFRKMKSGCKEIYDKIDALLSTEEEKIAYCVDVFKHASGMDYRELLTIWCTEFYKDKHKE